MAKIKLPDMIGCGFPVRGQVGVMIFTACFMTYMMRVNMSINILAMVENQPGGSTNATAGSDLVRDVYNNSDTVIVPHPEGKTGLESVRYNWTADAQGLVLGSYFWGYVLTSLPGGMLAERWGPRHIIGWTQLLSGLLTLAHPVVASWHLGAFITLRFLVGFFGGLLYPSCHVLVAQWAPPAEKGKFVSALMGGTIGTVVTWSLCGSIITYLNWEWAFYIQGILCVFWCALWFYFVADTPQDHKRISDKERKFIMDAVGDKIQKTKVLPPFGRILTSIPFLAMCVLHYGNVWGLHFTMTAAPTFISAVLGFDLRNAGFISGLPYVARMIFSVIFGMIGDSILQHKCLSTTNIRKIFTIFSHILPGILLILLVCVGKDPIISVLLITASMGANGAASITNLQNSQDLAPNFAGTLYGIANFVGSTSGFITPMITAYFTKDNVSGFAEWRYVFFIGAFVYIITACFFVLLGSGETQPWNTVVNPTDEEKPPEKEGSALSASNIQTIKL